MALSELLDQMEVSAAQILPLIALYLYWIISGMHNRFKHLADVNPMAKPKIKHDTDRKHPNYK